MKLGSDDSALDANSAMDISENSSGIPAESSAAAAKTKGKEPALSSDRPEWQSMEAIAGTNIPRRIAVEAYRHIRYGHATTVEGKASIFKLGYQSHLKRGHSKEKHLRIFARLDDPTKSESEKVEDHFWRHPYVISVGKSTELSQSQKEEKIARYRDVALRSYKQLMKPETRQRMLVAAEFDHLRHCFSQDIETCKEQLAIKMADGKLDEFYGRKQEPAMTRILMTDREKERVNLQKDKNVANSFYTLADMEPFNVISKRDASKPKRGSSAMQEELRKRNVEASLAESGLALQDVQSDSEDDEFPSPHELDFT